MLILSLNDMVLFIEEFRYSKDSILNIFISTFQYLFSEKIHHKIFISFFQKNWIREDIVEILIVLVCWEKFTDIFFYCFSQITIVIQGSDLYICFGHSSSLREISIWKLSEVLISITIETNELFFWLSKSISWQKFCN